MDLELSEEEAALRDNVRTVLAGSCPASVPRAVFDGGGMPADLWATMVDLGWPVLSIDERHGGLGMGYVELALLAEELGRAVAPSPLLATVTQFAPAIREIGTSDAADRFLPPVVEGTTTGTLALAEGGRWSPDAIRTTATRTGAGWVLDGDKSLVVNGLHADELLVIARGADGLGAFVVPSGMVRAVARRAIDPTLFLADVHLEAVEVDDTRVLAEPGSPVEHGLVRACEEATTAVAAVMVGACRRILELTVDYAKVREQYGRPIGSFQALKHRLVDMYLAVERATALLYYAALAIAEETPDRSIAVAAAKAGAGDCQRLLAEDGLQLHGGIGFTWEHDLHMFLKRAKACEAIFGTAVEHRAAIGSRLGLHDRPEAAA